MGYSKRLRLKAYLVFVFLVGLPMVAFSLFARSSARLRHKQRGLFVITTDKGVYVLNPESRELRRWILGHAFGIASGEMGTWYVSIYARQFSYVLKVRNTRRAWSLPHLFFWEPTMSRAGRIHQLDYHQDTVFIARSSTNSVLALDARTGEKRWERHVMVDASGLPIRSDNNHINSVFALDNGVIFVLHTLGGGFSGLGIMDSERFTVWRLGESGAHDVIPVEQGFFWSNSFGTTSLDSQSPRQEPSLVWQGFQGEWLELMPHTKFVRGVAVSKDWFVVGGSHHAKREKRLAGRGNLFLYRQSDEPLPDAQSSVLDVPFAQVYEILNFDSGCRHVGENRKISISEMRENLRALLGQEVASSTTTLLEASG